MISFCFLTQLKSICVELLFTRLRMARLKLKPSKCCLLRTEVAFLGHLVSDKGVATDPEKIAMIKDWPRPTILTELRSFVRICSYYRKFIFQFSQIASPLHALTGKERPFIWTDACEKAFNELKTLL